MATQDADCLIVGGGIGGAVLALALAQRGRRVIILERDTTAPPMPRPEILAGATIDAFASLGVADRILREAAVAIEGIELFEAGGRQRLFHVTQDDLRQAGARPQSTDPGCTRRILLEAAEQTGRVSLRRGVQVTGLIHEGGAVAGVEARRGEAPVSYRAPLTVGDDGTHSKIRESIRSDITLRPFAFDFFGAVVPRPAGQPPNIGQAWMRLAGVRDGLFAGLFLPIPGDRTALVFAATPQAAQQFERAGGAAFHEAAARLSPLAAEPGWLPEFPAGFGHFRRPFGHASAYVADGVALLGDAAHPVTPAGGQGANMSVADAMVLAEVADQALQAGRLTADQLLRYELARRAANHRSLQFSAQPTRVFNVLRAAPVLVPLLRRYVRYADARTELKRRFVSGVARAFVSSGG